MRSTLFQIRLDDWWTLSADGNWALGVGYLLVPWIATALWLLKRCRDCSDQRGEWLWPAGMIVVAVVVVMLPEWTAWKSAPIRGYSTMLIVGVLLAVGTAARRARHVGLPGEVALDLGILIALSGIAGARLFYVVQYHQKIFGPARALKEKFVAAIAVWQGGLVLYGGVLTALAALVVFCRWRRLNVLLMADLLLPSFFLGLAFGRLGCFLNGCCWGDPCQLPWAVTFPPESPPFHAGLRTPDGTACLPLHPTQLYGAVNALVLAWLTAVLFRRRSHHGAVLAVALIVYPVTRFVLEILRGDEPGQFGSDLTISQWVSLGLSAGGVAFGVWLARHNGRAATLPDKPTS